MAENEGSARSPRTDDGLEFQKAPAGPYPSGRGAVLLRNFIRAMNLVGDDAEGEYSRALKALRREASGVMVAIAEAFGASSSRDYPLRWSIVYAATKMGHNAALPFLREVLLTPIPPERSPNPHSFSTVGQETVLRTTAVDGLRDLAAKGRAQALETLFEALSIPSISVRRAAVQALLGIDKKLRKRIAECLPKEAHYLMEIERRDVRDVPQVKNPRRHVRKGANLKKAGAPPLDRAYETAERVPQDSPKLGG